MRIYLRVNTAKLQLSTGALLDNFFWAHFGKTEQIAQCSGKIAHWSSRFWDINLGLVDFLFDLEIWPLTLSQGDRKNISLNVNQVVLPAYQVWSGSVKWFRNYLKLKFFYIKVLSAGRLFVKWSPGSKTHKKLKISWFLKKKFFFW